MQKISIIVPIYNVEPFLRKCVKSLLDQTHENIEIILVNDGSPDNSKQICDDFALQDSRIKVIHQENKGLCGARNAGLDVATGDYIAFVDSDDYVTKDMFEYLLNLLTKTNSDISACRFFSLNNSGNISVRTDGIDHILSKEEAVEDIVTKFSLRTFFCNKLFKKELFSNKRFPEGFVFEGTHFIHEIFLEVDKVVFGAEAKYYYRDFSESIVNTMSYKNRIDYVYAHCKRYIDLHLLYPELAPNLLFDVVLNSIKLIEIYVRTPKKERNKYEEKLNYIRNFIKDYWEKITKHPEISKLAQIKLKAYLHNKSFSFRYSNFLINISRAINAVVAKFKQIFIRPKPIKTKPLGVNIDDFSEQDKIKMNKLQEFELEILEEFVRICKKHNLKYYLYGGTLLGAFRSNSFIPWDDDIDIVMPREDYDKFLTISQEELHADFFAQTRETDKEYPKLYLKIRKNNTYVREEKWDSRNMHKGVFIDILPLDNFPESKFLGKFYLSLFHVYDDVCNKNNHRTRQIFLKILYLILKVLPEDVSYKKRNKLLNKMKKYEKSENFCSFGSHYRPLYRRVLKKEWFLGEPRYKNFEGKDYMIPTKGELYLTHLFGKNYLTPPPVDQRINHFNILEVNFNVKKEKMNEKI